MLDLLKKIWLVTSGFICLIICTGTAQFTSESYTRHKYACDGSRLTSCLTNLYSIECSLGEKIAVKGVSYGAKPYTPYCPEVMSCVSTKPCCEYHKDDCMIPYHAKELWDVFMECSQGQQCGWLRAKSIELKDKCQIRKKSNYIRADFQCVSDDSFIDVCSQHSISARSVHLHHTSIFPGIYNYNQCSCLITPDDCNTTATLKFRSIDIRLQSKANFTRCSSESRIELIGQSEVKQYGCQPGEFLSGFEEFHTSQENNMVFYLYKRPLEFPTKLWLEVQGGEITLTIVYDLLSEQDDRTRVFLLFAPTFANDIHMKSQLMGRYFTRRLRFLCRVLDITHGLSYTTRTGKLMVNSCGVPNVAIIGKTTIPGVNVRVTCGPRSVQTAKRCPPLLPVTGNNIVDEVDELPEKNPNTPSVIYIPDVDGDGKSDDDEPAEKPSTALAALIGGIAAGVVVLILFLIVICIMLRKKRKRKEKADQVSYKQCLPYVDDPHPQMNYYETVNDPADNKSVTIATNTGSHIYHQPWEQRPGIGMPNRAKTGDLAYATSEEIKVLIENMERDRKFVVEGDKNTFPGYIPEPDRVYYRHMNDYTYQPEDTDDDDDDGKGENEAQDDSETESKSVNSENSGTEKVESEDSKVEADRGLDSDSESHRVESETLSPGYDGYESPRISTYHPSDTSSNFRMSSFHPSDASNKSSQRYSDYRNEFQRLVSQSSSVIAEDPHSDNDVPLEYAPPLSVANNQSELSNKVIDQSDVAKGREVRLGSYKEPRGSMDSGQGADSDTDTNGHYYTSVYDKTNEEQTKL